MRENRVSEKVYILDQITVQPGQAATYRDAYLAGYAPKARKRGMTLEHVRMTPPFEWREGSNTLHFLWSVDGVDGWWAMRIGGVDGKPLDTSGLANADWWEEFAHLVVSRRRDNFVDFAQGIVT